MIQKFNKIKAQVTMKTRTITALHYFEYEAGSMTVKTWDEILSSAANDGDRAALSTARAKALRWLERHPFCRISYIETCGRKIHVTDDRMVRTDYVDNTPTLHAALQGRVVAVCAMESTDIPKEDTVVYGRVASVKDKDIPSRNVIVSFEGDTIDPLEIRRDFAARLLYFADAEVDWLGQRGIQLLY